MRRLLAGFSLIIAAPRCSAHSRPPTRSAPISHLPAPLTTSINRLLSRTAIDQGLPGLSVAIARNGHIVYAKGFGYRNIGEHAGADLSTVYNIGSITKQFTAATILLLAQAGRLNIADPLNKYFPELPFAKAVSVRELLNHTSGIPDYFYVAGYRQGMNSADIVRLAATMPLLFRPGTAYAYSNTDYVLLGMIVERVAGIPYAQFVQNRIFRPAHMAASRVGDVPGSGADDAVGYEGTGTGFAPVSASSADLAYGAGAIDSTVVDLLRWDTALLGRRILKAPQLRQMFSAASKSANTTVQYGFGVHVGHMDGVPIIYHRGRNAGYSGVNVMFPGDDTAIAMLSNVDNFAPMLTAARLYALVHHQAPVLKDDPLPAGDSAVTIRARQWLGRLQLDDVDRSQLTADADKRYSSGAISSLASTLRSFGKLERLEFVEKDARYFGPEYTYRAFFSRAIAEYRFGVARGGKIWNLAIDRED